MKKGFTLAEVLITLGIIGVVAALTIPTLIQNQQKQETITRLRKMVSTITQAVKMSEVENGSMQSWDSVTSDWDPDLSRDWWNKYVIPYSNLSIIKECNSSNFSECWANDATFLDGTAFTNNLYLAKMLKDGSVLAFVTVSSASGQIYFDINGLKKPNVVGKDIFYIIVAYKAGLVGFPRGMTREYLLENHNGTCNTDAGSAKGSYCGSLIQLDGWQIKSDYPW